MLVVERHQIKRNHSSFKEIDHLAFLSKNLFNSIIYLLRQEWFEYLKFKKENKTLKFKFVTYKEIAKNWAACNHPDYRALPAKVSQHVLKQAFQTFKSFIVLLKAGEKARPPRYKDKLKGRNLLIYTAQAISSKQNMRGIKLSCTNIFAPVQTKNKIHQIRIVPGKHFYTLEIVYERYCKKKRTNINVAAIDLGVNNLATVTFNNDSPIIVPGTPLKSINQFYNKRKGALQSQLHKGQYWSHKLSSLTVKRNNKISDYLHKASRYIINYLVSHNISTLVIGRNLEWKQRINLGNKTNQNFVSIPFYKFIGMLQYKAALSGISIIEQEESYTSKCSFLDKENVSQHKVYAGKRIMRGLFKTRAGKLINADCNGSANIMKKAIPNVIFTNGIEAVVVQLRRVKASERNNWSI